MAEYITNNEQLVDTNNNLIFTDTVVSGCCNIIHRAGSGIITLRGVTGQSCTRFKVTFSGNVALPATTTTPTEPISLAIAIDGEPILSTTMISTPGAVSEYNNVSTATYIDVPNCCCATIAVENTSSQSINIKNANIIISRD